MCSYVNQAHTFVYFGTYSSGEGKGVFVAELDLATGALNEPRAVYPLNNPSFVAIHPSRKFLYSVADISLPDGKWSGGVFAFEISADGSLQLINQQSSIGSGPCHVSVDQAGKVLFIANYADGVVVSYPLGADGSIGSAASTFRHQGSGPNKNRQSSPHAHSINVDPGNQHAYAADLGIDQLRIYTFDPETAALAENSAAFVATPPGGGPRHLSFHPSGCFAYCCLEMSCEMCVLRHDPETGAMKVIQTLSTLPDGTPRPIDSTAECLVHPNGNFLYVSNRGHDSIAIFSIDPESGLLTAIGNESSRGKCPRNFGIDPSGNFLLVANQDSGDIRCFRIDPTSGLINYTGHSARVPAPVCVRLVVR